jgi:hypothetical protein
MVALDPSGKTLAFASAEIDFGLWETASGEQLRELIGHKGRVGRGSVSCAVFSPDGHILASGGVDGTIRLWEASTGKTRRVLTAHKDGVTGLAFSPDGRAIVSTGIVVGGNVNFAYEGSDTVHVWDASTGCSVRTFSGESSALVFSADGKRLAGIGAATKAEKLPNGGVRIGPEYHLHVWDFASGRRQMKILGKADAAAFTPDGLLLLMATGESLRVWEVDTGQEILTCPLPQKDVSKVAFSPDGATLAVGQQDGTVYLWAVSPHQLYVPADKPHSDAEWEQLWGDLASDKAATAYRALWTLRREPPRAAALLRKHLHPSAKRDLPLDKWIAALDSDDYNARQQALRSLRQSGEIAEHALRQAREGKLSLEARKRIDQLLEDLGQRRPSAERLRSLRAIQLLEEIGSPEAREVLETLAKGWSEDRQTREAKAALARQADKEKHK